MNHFDEITCMLYLDGQLDRERARELTAHTQECAECQGLLGVLAGEGRWLKEALMEADEAVPARLFEPRTRPNTVPWGWIAAFGFGSAGAYTLWNSILEPVQSQFDQAGFSSQNLFTVLLFNGAFWKGWESMRSLVEFLAMSAFGILILLLFRRNWRRGTTLAVVMASMLCALFLPSAADAAEVHKTAGEYVLGAGEEVKNDLIVYGGLIRIEGKVDGDVIAFGQSVRIDGHVTGDVIAFARDVRVSGQVDGNVRSFVQSLTIEGQVGKNISSFSDTTEIDAKGKIGRNIYLFAGLAIVGGEVGRDAAIHSGTTRLVWNRERGSEGFRRTAHYQFERLDHRDGELPGDSPARGGARREAGAPARDQNYFEAARLRLRPLLLAPGSALGFGFPGGTGIHPVCARNRIRSRALE